MAGFVPAMTDYFLAFAGPLLWSCQGLTLAPKNPLSADMPMKMKGTRVRLSSYRHGRHKAGHPRITSLPSPVLSAGHAKA
jgi:hypothetical protein